MSTIASPRISPRPSLSLSSRRGSASTDNTITSASSKPTASSVADRGSLRRNRAALRDYYNLQTTAQAASISSEPPTPTTLDAAQESELDKPGFSPEEYVTHLLSNSGLEGVLRVEAGLVSDIRSLDGEKKALVYDNYSKLIAATETIRSMREKMEPLSPGTSTLSPAIGHIAETAAGLKKGLREHAQRGENGLQQDKQQQRKLVRWVLGAPDRIERMNNEGEKEAAQDEWRQVEKVLDKWKGVDGVDEVKKRCLVVLEGDSEG
ncbi:hypothetical protein M409DRAFT_64219 [Zasmidium cellare ATCC 36951]|uniref:Vacuolar protein sorting-associated protein 51 homolog n=1 Tax=Zasmidium cellare ATCC 36951 TaxID=1080233 RepID=A0A6A6CTX8_ZASCE|nr:uncharacterized protein M409DRAFT_64219 [Zasmidium cellare ATCC 36951]KAF2170505.1 hypothetical protein M409DRAFT_64219 [Zasmidium cellare ATCC 36951]